jgi:hypothetical protein
LRNGAARFHRLPAGLAEQAHGQQDYRRMVSQGKRVIGIKA